MLDPAQLAALAAIHRHGAFDRAAKELGVTPSAVSQRLKALEERLGTRLIIRGQPCTATPAGLRAIRHLDEISLLEQDLARDLPGLSAGPAVIRIAVNADSLATWILPALALVPGALFDLVIDDQEVSQDWLIRGEVLGSITAHPGPLQGCETLPLGRLRYRATATPDFVARHFPDGVTADALTRAPALRFNAKDLLQHRWAARETGGTVTRLPCHQLASAQGFVEAALLGLGWGLHAEALVRDHLAAGRLVELKPETPLDTPLFWQFARLAGPALAPLTRAFRAEAARHLHP
jgi:LysR family transcriptional regulator (chromosome initiation inhibitor)